MVQTFFEIDGERYKLKYQKLNTEEGELYQGILFLENAIGFSYLIREDQTILFDNDFIDKNFQHLIIRIIEHREKRIKLK